MKKCETCRYGSEYELDKPCIVYRENCPMYEKEGDGMTNEQAKAEIMQIYGVLSPNKQQALDMAIKALENISHITDRPCDVCEFHSEQGCTQWKCVFCDELFGGMRR